VTIFYLQTILPLNSYCLIFKFSFFVVRTTKKPIIIYRGEKTEGLAKEYLITIIALITVVLILILAILVRICSKKKKKRKQTILLTEGLFYCLYQHGTW